MTHLLGGIEAGGTKFICAVGTGPTDIRAETRFPTTTPAENLRQCIEFFQQHAIVALGVASFGPIDLRRDSATYGYITSTPKPGWANADVVGPLQAALKVPIGFDTDVNGAALGEWRWGAAQHCDPVIYLTVGTGIGGGLFIHGRLAHGLIHPEMGHILLPHDRQRDPFEGACPFHGDCFEGLAAGPALEKRWGQKAETLPPDHPAWELEAHYIGLALAAYICTVSPQKIVIGGGVSQQPQMLPLIRQHTLKALNNYVRADQLLNDIDHYIVAPGLGGRAGVAGALALAETVISEQ